jgi:hypothetical protein
MKKFTYRDMLSAMSTFTDEQLDMEVRWSGDESGGELSGFWIVEEDQINPSGDGMEPVSVYANDPDVDVDAEEIVCKKGTPILLEKDYGFPFSNVFNL